MIISQETPEEFHLEDRLPPLRLEGFPFKLPGSRDLQGETPFGLLHLPPEGLEPAL